MSHSESRITKTPPHFIEGEKAIVGACLLDNTVIPRVLAEVGPEHFYSSPHRKMFEAVSALYPAQVVDYLTVSSWLKDKGFLELVGGTEKVIEIAERLPSVANVMHYVTLVKEKSNWRKLVDLCRETLALADTDTPIEDAVSGLQTTCLGLVTSNEKTGLSAIREINRRSYAAIERQWKQGTNPGCPTGFSWIDARTGGMRPGELWVVCARPSMGKSSFALNVATNLCVQGHPVFFFSLEMQNEALWGRMVSRESGLPFWLIRNARFTEDEFGKIVTAVGEIDELNFWADDKSMLSPSEILLRCQRVSLEEKKRPALIVIDYLQIMKPDKGKYQTREREIASMCAAVKDIAKQLACPIMLLSQLNREVVKRTNQRPQLSDLRESGAIEQDADVVIGIYRKWPLEQIEENKTHAEIGILKQRNGPIGWDTDVEWNPNTVSFRDKFRESDVYNPPSYQEPREFDFCK